MAIETVRDKYILVAEDEFLLAEDLCYELRAIGAIVVGPVPSVELALKLIATEPLLQAAVLDANLGGDMICAVADELQARCVPFVFTSGYDDAVLKCRYPQVLRFQKPTQFSAIAEALGEILADRG